MHVIVLIAKLAIPASIGMFSNTLYNVVDTYFSGLISTKPLDFPSDGEINVDKNPSEKRPQKWSD